MIIHLDRFYRDNHKCVGKLYIDNIFICNTIEDPERKLPLVCPYTPKYQDCKCKEKIKHKTAIPTGAYNVTLEMSPSKKRLLPYLHNVPHFLGILIHSGKNEDWSSGCIIVGRYQGSDLLESEEYEKKIVDILKKAKSKGESIEILIT